MKYSVATFSLCIMFQTYAMNNNNNIENQQPTISWRPVTNTEFEQKYKELQSLYFDSISAGSELSSKKFDTLLSKYENIQDNFFIKTLSGDTLVHRAAEEDDDNGHRHIHTLRRIKVPFDEVNNFHETPLMIAAQNGNSTCVYLIEAGGGSVTKKNCIGWTALHCAVSDHSLLGKKYSCSAKRMEIIDFLCQQGAYIPGENNAKDRISPFCKAASSGNGKAISYFYNKHYVSSIDMQDGTGWTALCCAVLAKKDKALVTLLNLGANPNAVNKDTNTPLHELFTFYNSHPLASKIKPLLQQGANIYFLNRNGQTPYSLACERLKKLLEEGSLVNSNQISSTSWQACCDLIFQHAKELQRENFKCIENLNKYDLNYIETYPVEALFVTNKDKQTLLHEAAMQDNVNACAYLLSKGVPIDSQDCRGATPLLYSSANTIYFFVGEWRRSSRKKSKTQ